MTETTNYHLNQWVKDDRIRMEDFNADNAKLDAALAALKARLDALEARNLWSVVATARADGASQQLDLSLSGVDLTQYAMLVTHIQIPAGSGPVDLLVNGQRGEVYYSSDEFGSHVPGFSRYLARLDLNNAPTVTLHSPRRGCYVAAKTEQAYQEDNFMMTYLILRLSRVKWENVTSFNLFYDSQNVPAGTVFTLFGLKQ